MQLSLRKIALASVVIILFNLVVAQVTYDYVQPALVEAAIDEWENHLNEVATDLEETFSTRSSAQWEAEVLKASERHFADAYIVKKDNLEGYEQELLVRAILNAQQSFIDISTSSVYYRLDSQQLVLLENVYFDSFINWLSDWVLWLVASLLNLLFLGAFTFYCWKEQQRLAVNIANLNQKPSTQAHSIDEQINYIKQYLAEISAQNQAQLNLQRDLLHGVAHEFRSPMARMQFALDMLEDADDEAKKELTCSIQSSLQGLDDLVKELLSYARLKDGSTVLNVEKITLSEIASQAIEQVETFYPDIQFELEENTMAACVDNHLLTRLFINLLRNAGRFAKSTCRISFEHIEDYLICYIEDDGMGIPPGKIARIFEPFTRLDPSRSRDSGGCGLGLAIASSIAQLHQGQLTVIEKQEGLGGACFSLKLPLTI